MSTEKKGYLAQMSLLGDGHKARYFDSIEEARIWLLPNGGGTIKKRNAGVMYGIGDGSDRVVFDPPLRVWGEIEEVVVG